MPIPVLSLPPDARTNYVISQLEGEKLTIPGSKGTFRILASAKQTNGAMSIFQSGAVLSDAPGFHFHNYAHDVFMVTKGFLKLYNGPKCRIMGPGDFAYIPPAIIHNPELLGPHTETVGLVTPGNWIDFFRYVGETYHGLIVPEHDNRDLKGHIVSKMIPAMQAKKDFDVNFVRDPNFKPPAVSDWEGTENVLPGELEPYFLRANTGPRWMAGGIMSRPFITTKQSGGKFAISSIESSGDYGASGLFEKYVAFPSVDHCFVVFEGALKVNLKGEEAWTTVREGETLVIAAGQAFKLGFGSKYVRAWSFTGGKGIEALVEAAGDPYEAFVLPDRADVLGADKVRVACGEIGAELE
ncbi:RmlC-like cupin domain-containing protein [Pseudomassariella vexata]|uniref:RmlC-like cupin domain-containing protein n=1 Tax=Pseudomassariella vexata TaxID=1141098 RepID=A0A1Y2EDA9_9PEZI|nr:RmlC-like cupin domain-containing protein [Pseudomassariella vexata]ORY69551.1 RmlC-like cupin domain-containing protein [Pseudomassariella vexata]